MSAPKDSRSWTMSAWFAVTATSKAVCTSTGSIHMYFKRPCQQQSNWMMVFLFIPFPCVLLHRVSLHPSASQQQHRHTLSVPWQCRCAGCWWRKNTSQISYEWGHIIVVIPTANFILFSLTSSLVRRNRICKIVIVTEHEWLTHFHI